MVCQALNLVDVRVGPVVDLVDNQVLDLIKFNDFFLEGERRFALHFLIVDELEYGM